jgi:hypothetical protein
MELSDEAFSMITIQNDKSPPIENKKKTNSK